ncbi:MAG: Dot/Icm secretion system protein IcmQ [Gammaproteobacteria bacterium]|nr:Dot/Icm secretion system protein IcmQ [Gammaproteobacteria bacterium]
MSQEIFHQASSKKAQKIKLLQEIDNDVVKALSETKTLYKLEEKEASVKLVALLDDLLSKEDWESSLLLKAAKKRIEALLEEAKQVATELNGTLIATTHEPTKFELKENQVKVYISLYQTEGASIKSWQNMLRSLGRYSMTRPVYEDEAHVREVVRSKPDALRHAYAVVAVEKTAIIDRERTPVDKFGHHLLTLKENTVKLSNIIEFVHANSKRYVFQQDRLVLID